MSDPIKEQVLERLSYLNKRGMVKELESRGCDTSGNAREIKTRLAGVLYRELERDAPTHGSGENREVNGPHEEKEADEDDSHDPRFEFEPDEEEEGDGEEDDDLFKEESEGEHVEKVIDEYIRKKLVHKIRDTMANPKLKDLSLEGMKEDNAMEFKQFLVRLEASTNEARIIPRSEFDNYLQGKKELKTKVDDWLYDVLVRRVPTKRITNLVGVKKGKGMMLLQALHESYVGENEPITTATLMDKIKEIDVSGSIDQIIEQAKEVVDMIPFTSSNMREHDVTEMLMRELKEGRFATPIGMILAVDERKVYSLEWLRKKLYKLSQFVNKDKARKPTVDEKKEVGSNIPTEGKVMELLLAQLSSSLMNGGKSNGSRYETQERRKIKCWLGCGLHDNLQECKADRTAVLCTRNGCGKAGHTTEFHEAWAIHQKVVEARKAVREARAGRREGGQAISAPNNSHSNSRSQGETLELNKIELDAGIANKPTNETRTILATFDTAASETASPLLPDMVQQQEQNKKFKLADGSVVASAVNTSIQGTVQTIDGTSSNMSMSNINVIPGVQSMLIAGSAVVGGGHTAVLSDDQSFIIPNSTVSRSQVPPGAVPFAREGNLWQLPIQVESLNANQDREIKGIEEPFPIFAIGTRVRHCPTGKLATVMSIDHTTQGYGVQLDGTQHQRDTLPHLLQTLQASENTWSEEPYETECLCGVRILEGSTVIFKANGIASVPNEELYELPDMYFPQEPQEENAQPEAEEAATGNEGKAAGEAAMEEDKETIELAKQVLARLLQKMARLMQWHERMGHISLKATVQNLQWVNHSEDFSDLDLESDIWNLVKCPHCPLANIRQSSLGKKHDDRSTKCCSVTHADAICKVAPATPSGLTNAFLFEDDTSRDSELYFSGEPNCDNAILAFKHYMSDNGGSEKFRGGQFISDAGIYKEPKFQDFLVSMEIRFYTSTSHRHELNGVAESRVNVIKDMSRVFFSQSHVPTENWAYAMSHANFVKRHLLTRPIGMAPITKKTGKKSNFDLLHTWGCRVVIKDYLDKAATPEDRRLAQERNKKVTRHKRRSLEEKGITGVYLGVAKNASHYTHIVGILDDNHRPTKITGLRYSRDLVFFEEDFPFRHQKSPVIRFGRLGELPVNFNDPAPLGEMVDGDDIPTGAASDEHSRADEIDEAQGLTAHCDPDRSVGRDGHPKVPRVGGAGGEKRKVEATPTRKSDRIRAKNKEEEMAYIQSLLMQNNKTMYAHINIVPVDEETDDQEGNIYYIGPKDFIAEDAQEEITADVRKKRLYVTPATYQDVTIRQLHQLLGIEQSGKGWIPKNYKDAVENDKTGEWTNRGTNGDEKGAIWKEYDGVFDHGTVEEVEEADVPAHEDIYDLLIIFDRKRDGTAKVRICIRGDRVKLKDFQETFSPTSSMENLKLLLAVESFKRKFGNYPPSNENKRERWVRRALDIKNAFVNADIDVPVYVRPPPGFYQPGQKQYVWKIVKALYGLRQAPRLYYKLFKKLAGELGYQPSEVDPCIFVKSREVGNGEELICTINTHVDDNYLMGEEEEVEEVYSIISQVWESKDLGVDPSDYLGLEFQVDKDGDVGITQERLIDEMLEQFNMKDDPVTRCPHESTRLQEPVEDNPDMSFPLRSLVGGCLFASRGACPQIGYDVYALSRHLNKYDGKIAEAGKRLLRYLKGVKNIPFPIKATKTDRIIEVWADSDHLGEKGNKCKSVSGYVIKVLGVPVACGSKANYSACVEASEAELVALHHALKKAVHFAKLLVDIKFIPEELAEIWIKEDNQGAIKALENSLGTSGLKHIRVKLRWMQDWMEDEIMHVEFCPTKSQLADMYTKPVPGPQFYTQAGQINPNLLTRND